MSVFRFLLNVHIFSMTVFFLQFFFFTMFFFQCYWFSVSAFFFKFQSYFFQASMLVFQVSIIDCGFNVRFFSFTKLSVFWRGGRESERGGGTGGGEGGGLACTRFKATTDRAPSAGPNLPVSFPVSGW